MDELEVGTNRRRLNPAMLLGPAIAMGAAVACVLSARFALRAFSGWRTDRDARGTLMEQAAAKKRAAGDGSSESGDGAGDDLTVIAGIGPRVAAALRRGGVETYRQLAAMRPGRLTTILRESGGRLANPATWPEQARLAARGKWQDLRDLQGSLRPGKRAH